MISNFKKLLTNSVMRNIFIVSTGVAGAHTITIIFAPLITRIFGPEAYGQLGTFLAFVSVVGPLSALTYPIAIVLPRRDGDALGIAALSLYVSLFFFCLLFFAFLYFANSIVMLLNIESFEPYLLYIPFAMLFSAWIQVCQQWLIRKRRFGYLAKAALINSTIENVSKVCIGLFAPFVGILIGLTTAFGFVYATILILFSIRSYRSADLEKYSRVPYLALASRHRDFPIYRMPQNLINAASQSLPVLMIAAFFGPASAGFYSLAKMVMGVPSALIGKSVSDVFYPIITEAYFSQQNVAGLIFKGTISLLLVGVFPFGIIALFGPDVFELVFGENWREAGEYSRWLALFFLLNFVNKPCVASVPVLGLQKGLLFYEIFSTAIKVIALIVGFYGFSNDLVAVALFSITGVIAYTLMIVWIILEARKWDRRNETSR